MNRLIVAMTLAAAACIPINSQTMENLNLNTPLASAQTKVLLTVDDRSVTATLADNEATRKLSELLLAGPITISMEDYGGFEKVGELPQSLPTSNTQITTEPGDIMLYQGNNMVIFYGSNSWSYTRLGKIDDATAQSVRDFLGSGNISLRISRIANTGVDEMMSGDSVADDRVYDMGGRLVSSRPLPPGLYIINGKKILK